MEYPGGKNQSGVYQWLINLMPPHDIYAEPFLGSGAVMRLKRPAVASIGVDADDNVLMRWRGDVPGLTLLHMDALEFLATDLRLRLPNTLCYLDPPYLMAARSSKRAIYRHEFGTEAEHARLIDTIRGLPCMVAISGYYSELYATELSDWRAVQRGVRTRGGKWATEWCWMNYAEPFELHDYRYLGDGFRERDQIKRFSKRWLERLLAMPSQKRYAILEALAQARSAATAPGVMGAPALRDPLTTGGGAGPHPRRR